MKTKLLLSLTALILLTGYSKADRKPFNDKDVFGTRVFIENKGQFNGAIPSKEKVAFALDNGEEKIFFTNEGLTYKIVKHFLETPEEKEEYIENYEKFKDKKDKVYYVNMNWVNANPNIQIEQTEKTSNYFTYGGKETISYGYKKLTYKNVYNNIDIEYVIPMEKEGGIKYNVIVHPGANPADVKIAYTGDVKGISLKDGNVVIKTPMEPIIEHKPESFYSSKQDVESGFNLSSDIISFNFPKGFDKTKTLVIDPFVSNVTSLANNNYAYDIDYDNFGNVFIYGGTSNFKIAQYTPGGTLNWTFMGSVTTPAWSTGFYAGNFVVEKATSKCYTGEGFNGVGTRVIRLTAAGAYDNFITTANQNWRECWDLGVHCSTSSVFGLGGGTNGPTAGGLINSTNAAVTLPPGFIPAFTFCCQDIASTVLDDAGNIFVYYSSSNFMPYSQLWNVIARLNTAFTTTVWAANSTYNSLTEVQNRNQYQGAGVTSNGFNCLAVNGNFVFFYDGFNVAAYNRNTGAKVGFTTVGGNTVARQGGIAVDDCNNVYVGGSNNQLNCFSFNGTNFSALGNIPLNAASNNKYVYDVRLDKKTNLLYVCGSGFFGTYSAIHSLNCMATNYTVTPFCNGSVGGAVASMTTTVSQPTVDYIWTNGSGTVSSTFGSNQLTNTVTPLANGSYTVTFRVNYPCGPTYTAPVIVSCPTCSVVISATTGCIPILGGTTTSLSVNSTWGYTPQPTYSWTGPGGFSSTSSNPSFLNNGTYGVYTITASNFTCQYTTTVATTPVAGFTPAATSTAVLCFGGNTGLATTTVQGGVPPYTYQWSNTQTSQTASGLQAGVYTCTVIDSRNCLFTTSVQVTQPPALTIAVISNTDNVCAGKTINASGSSSGGVGPYTYTWTNGPNGSAYNITEIVPGTYVYTLTSTDANGCVISGVLPLTFNQIPIITVSSQTICYNDKGTLIANGAEQFQWMPVNFSGSTYTTTGVNTMYVTVVGTNTSTGCSSVPVTATLLVNPLPVPSIAMSNNKGCVPLCMTFTAANSGAGVQTCSWDFGDGSFASNVINTDRCYTMAGKYKVRATVTDINGCVNYVTDSLEGYPIPIADFIYSPLKPIVNLDEVIFTDASHEAIIAKWDWYFMNLPKPHSNLQNPTYNYLEPGTYPVALVVTSDHGCLDTIVKTIIVGEDYGIYVPNIFTPNGDGLNDIFQPKGFGITKYELRIFNRWGEQLMFTNDFAHGWDGFYKGKLSQEDTYIWKINLTNVFGKSHELSGHVTLIK